MKRRWGKKNMKSVLKVWKVKPGLLGQLHLRDMLSNYVKQLRPLAELRQEMLCVLQSVPDLILLPSQHTDVWRTDFSRDTMFRSKIAPNYFCFLWNCMRYKHYFFHYIYLCKLCRQSCNQLSSGWRPNGGRLQYSNQFIIINKSIIKRTMCNVTQQPVRTLCRTRPFSKHFHHEPTRSQWCDCTEQHCLDTFSWLPTSLISWSLDKRIFRPPVFIIMRKTFLFDCGHTGGLAVLCQLCKDTHNVGPSWAHLWCLSEEQRRS